MSLHKAQGQTFRKCGVYLPCPVFAHGQLYVGASRTSSAAGLRFLLGKNNGHGYEETVPHTHNIVYRSVLQMATGLQPTSCAKSTSLKRKDDISGIALPGSRRRNIAKTAPSADEEEGDVMLEPTLLEQDQELLDERPEKYSDEEDLFLDADVDEDLPQVHHDDLLHERPEKHSDEEEQEVEKDERRAAKPSSFRRTRPSKNTTFRRKRGAHRPYARGRRRGFAEGAFRCWWYGRQLQPPRLHPGRVVLLPRSTPRQAVLGASVP